MTPINSKQIIWKNWEDASSTINKRTRYFWPLVYIYVYKYIYVYTHTYTSYIHISKHTQWLVGLTGLDARPRASVPVTCHPSLCTCTPGSVHVYTYTAEAGINPGLLVECAPPTARCPNPKSNAHNSANPDSLPPPFPLLSLPFPPRPFFSSSSSYWQSRDSHHRWNALGVSCVFHDSPAIIHYTGVLYRRFKSLTVRSFFPFFFFFFFLFDFFFQYRDSFLLLLHRRWNEKWNFFGNTISDSILFLSRWI